MFWILFCFFILLFAHLGDYKVTTNNNIVIFSRLLLVFTLAYTIALCGEGNDKDNYIDLLNFRLDTYYESDILNWISLDSQNLEFGFYVLCKFCQILGFSALGILFIISIITNAFIVQTFYRFKYPVLIFFLYILSLFYIQQTNLTRQLLAVSIGLYSLRFIDEKKIVLFLIWVFVAFLVHKSAFVVLLYVPFYSNIIRNNANVHIVMFSIWVGSLLIAHSAVANMIPFLSNILSVTRYAAYIDEGKTLGVGEQVFDIIYNLMVLYYFLFGDKNPQRNMYAYGFIMGCVFANISITIIVVQRISYYFNPFYCAFIPEMLAMSKLAFRNKIVKYLLFLLIIMYRGRVLTHNILEGSEQIGNNIHSLSEIF